MKNITESLNEIQGLTPYLKGEQQIDEGLKDILKVVKNKFKQAFAYLKGIVVKVGSYFVPTTEEGIALPVVSPLTAGSAYVDGLIDPTKTFVHMTKEGERITGCKTNLKNATKIYGPGNSIDYWVQCLNESEQEKENFATILEYFENYNKEHNIVNEVKLHTEDPQAKYNIITDDDELKDKIKTVLKNKKLARLLIWGAPGIGKTAILLNVLDEMKSEFPNYQLICKTLSNETPDNFTLPKYVVEVDDDDFKELAKKLGREPSAISKLLKKVGIDKATDVPKTWLPVYKPTGDATLDAYFDEQCGEGLLFVDELSRASQQVLNVILPLINEGMFNGYKLGSGWTIVCASNRQQDENSGQSKLGNALVNRFIQVHYEPTVKTWEKWAKNQNFISPLLLQWLNMPESEDLAGGKFFYMDPNEDSSALADTTLICTPRSWTNAMRLLATYSHTGKLEGFDLLDIPTSVIASTLNSCIPAVAIDSFMGFLAVIREIGNFDAAVHSIWQEGGKGFKIDKKNLNKVALPLAQLIVCAHSKTLPTKKEWDNLVNWLIAQNSDQLASYVLDLYTNVFLGSKGLHEKLFGQAFYMQVRIKQVKGDMSKLGTFVSTFADWCNQWGIKLENIPDWSDGLNKLVDKYGASFESAIVDAHKSALG